MVEWSITPDYIINNWTDELLYLMTVKLNERIKKMAGDDGKTTDADLFMRAGNMIKVEKR